MLKNEVPVILVTGYLGSGKTTLMQNILMQEKRHIALIVNDMGSVNIDAKILNKTENKMIQVEMVQMQNGCICCTLKEEFLMEIERLSMDESIEAIFIEASGISEPSAIAGAFMEYKKNNPNTRVYLKTIASVVDVDRIYKEFLSDIVDDRENDDGDIINLVMDQIEFCNLIILNKIDLLSNKELEEVKSGLRNIQKEAPMLPSSYGNLDIDQLLGGEDFDYEKVLTSSTLQRALMICDANDSKACVDEYGISSFVFEERKPFNREKFLEFLNDYPKQLIRAKGYIWFSDDEDKMQLFEQAGRNASITELSEWVAAWPSDELEKLIAEFPDITDDWDNEYGDRCNEIVFIGKEYEKEDIIKMLYECIDVSTNSRN